MTLHEGALILDGLFWPANRLIWKEHDTFYVESWPFEAIFEEGPGGAIRSLTIRG